MAARAVMIFFPNLAKFFSYCHGQNKLKTRASVLSRVCNKNSIKKKSEECQFCQENSFGGVCKRKSSLTVFKTGTAV